MPIILRKPHQELSNKPNLLAIYANIYHQILEKARCSPTETLQINLFINSFGEKCNISLATEKLKNNKIVGKSSEPQ